MGVYWTMFNEHLNPHHTWSMVQDLWEMYGLWMCGLGWLDSEHQVKLRNNFSWSVVHVGMDWIDGPLMMGYLYLLVWLVWNISIWAPEEGQLWSLVGQDVLPGKVWSLARKDWMVEVFRSSRLTPGRNRGGVPTVGNISIWAEDHHNFGPCWREYCDLLVSFQVEI